MKSQLALTIAVGLLFSLALSKLVPLEEIEQDPVELNKNWLSHYEKSKAALEHVEGFIPSSCQTNFTLADREAYAWSKCKGRFPCIKNGTAVWYNINTTRCCEACSCELFNCLFSKINGRYPLPFFCEIKFAISVSQCPVTHPPCAW